MSPFKGSGVGVHTNDVLDIVGNLVSQLKAFGAKLPTVVPTASVSGGGEAQAGSARGLRTSGVALSRPSSGNKISTAFRFAY